jgi:hypothetical protein
LHTSVVLEPDTNPVRGAVVQAPLCTALGVGHDTIAAPPWSHVAYGPLKIHSPLLPHVMLAIGGEDVKPLLHDKVVVVPAVQVA